MAQTVYILCALTSLICAVLLGRAWRANRVRLLLWSAVCFGCLTATNILLFVDRIILPTEVDLMPLRAFTTLLGLCAMLYGLVFESN